MSVSGIVCTPCCNFDDTCAEEKHPSSFSTVLGRVGRLGFIRRLSAGVVDFWREVYHIICVRLFLLIMHCVGSETLRV